MKAASTKTIMKFHSKNMQYITLIQETYYSSLKKSNIATSFGNGFPKIKNKKLKFTPFPIFTENKPRMTCNTFRPKCSSIFEKIIGINHRKISVSDPKEKLENEMGCYDIDEISDFELDNNLVI